MAEYTCSDQSVEIVTGEIGGATSGVLKDLRELRPFEA